MSDGLRFPRSEYWVGNKREILLGWAGLRQPEPTERSRDDEGSRGGRRDPEKERRGVGYFDCFWWVKSKVMEEIAGFFLLPTEQTRPGREEKGEIFYRQEREKIIYRRRLIFFSTSAYSCMRRVRRLAGTGIFGPYDV